MAKELTETQKIDLLKEAVDELDLYREGVMRGLGAVISYLGGDDPHEHIKAGMILTRLQRDLFHAEHVIDDLPCDWVSWGSGWEMPSCDCENCRCCDDDGCDDGDGDDFSGRRMRDELNEFIRGCFDNPFCDGDDPDDI